MTDTSEKQPVSEQKPASEPIESEVDLEWEDWDDEAKPSIHVEEPLEKE
jgi:hypothetical protein